MEMIRINFEHFSFQGETAISLSNWMMKVEVQEQTPEFCQNAYKGMLFKPWLVADLIPKKSENFEFSKNFVTMF